MADDDDPLRGEEERHIDRALKHCKQLEHTLRLSLVQVKLLNRKYCAPIRDSPSCNSPATTPKTTQNLRTCYSECRLPGPQTLALRISRSMPEFGQRMRSMPLTRIFRPLNDILLQSNEIHVQLIKIRRHFEGCLLRVEFLVRTYCKQKDNRRWSADRLLHAIGGGSANTAAVVVQRAVRRRHSDMHSFQVCGCKSRV